MIVRLELEAGEYVLATDYIRALRVRQLIKGKHPTEDACPA